MGAFQLNVHIAKSCVGNLFLTLSKKMIELSKWTTMFKKHV